MKVSRSFRMLSILLVLCLVLLPQTASQAAAGDTTRVSVASDGTEANSNSSAPSISADGRYVVFPSSATNLVAGDTNDDSDIFVHDRQSGATRRVSVDSSGVEGNNPSFNASISADGRYVAFTSRASNLVAGDTNDAIDIFVHDRVSGVTSLISVASDGTQANDDPSDPSAPSISTDGRYVAFHSVASNLVGEDTNAASDVFVHDRQTGETSRVSVDSTGVEGNGRSFCPSISAGGRYVAFFSRASNLVAGDTNAAQDVFVHDRQSGETSRVSVDSSGVQGNNTSSYSSISADGRYVAFRSGATNLVAGDTNGGEDVFVHDRQSGVTTRISVASDGTQVYNSTGFNPPWISADGRYVTFETFATNLVVLDTNNINDVFVHDRQNGWTFRVSVASDGTQSNSSSLYPIISADGRNVAFFSFASNLVAGDTNATYDVFVHELDEVCVLTYTAGPNGTITGTRIQTMEPGQDGAPVTAVPNTGYHFTGWSDGVTTPSRTDLDVTGSISVTANFAINQYTLTYAAGANGALTGVSPQIVNHGSSGTAITAVPNATYHFVQWSDGSTANPRTDANVTANVDVTASFAIDQYTLTYTAGTGGSISGTTPQTVDHGGSGTGVTAVPNTGHHFVKWSDGLLTPYRIDLGIISDFSVTAIFAPLGSFTNWAGSVAITSNRSVVAVARPHVSDEVASYDGVNSGSLTAYAPMLFQGSFGGSYNSAFYVQNVDAEDDAHVTVKFFDSTGTESCSFTDTITPLASKGYWTPSVTCATGSLPAGWVGGAVVASDRNIVAVGRPHVGAQVMTYNGFSSGSLTSYLPMLFKNSFGGGYDSAFYVQNVNTTNTANITIKFFDSDGTESCTLTDTVAPLASKGFWVPTVTCDTGSLPAGWVGGVVVTSNQPVVTIARLHIDAEVTSYSGFAGGSGSMHVPMLFKNAFGGSYDSAFYVQNVDAAPASITIKFYDSAGDLSCTRTDTVEPLASKGFWVPTVTCDTGALPAGWVGGAVIVADRNIVAVGRPHVGTQVTSYPGIANGGSNLYIPMLFKEAFGGSYNAAFYVQNTDEVNDATVTLKFYDLAGHLACTRTDTIPSLATLGYWVPSMTCDP